MIPTSNHNCLLNQYFWVLVVYLLIPTSNHNRQRIKNATKKLYIFWFLHQTTTNSKRYTRDMSCISFDSYIKPQPQCLSIYRLLRCISFDSYIKPQRLERIRSRIPCCISFDSYIKPQRLVVLFMSVTVVYLLIPTSNHNLYVPRYSHYMLYIFWFLHQTTTTVTLNNGVVKLYIFWFLHQTTTDDNTHISVAPLYIFWFLHQTTTSLRLYTLSTSCISFDSYIKPQPNLLISYYT